MSSRIRTLRGTITVGKNTLKNSAVPNYYPIRLRLNNGDMNENFRVKSFRIFPCMNNTVTGYGFWNSVVNNSDNLYVTLCLDERHTLEVGDFSNSGQIGWAVASSQAVASNVLVELDPNHIVVNDLYIGAYAVDLQDGSTDATSVPLNYIVEIEPVKSTDTQAVWQLLNENLMGDRD